VRGGELGSGGEGEIDGGRVCPGILLKRPRQRYISPEPKQGHSSVLYP